jgi:hypothetical protein
MDDIAVDMTGGNTVLFVRKAKGDQRNTAANKPLSPLPIATIPLLADLLEAFTTRRTSYCNQLDNGPEPTTFWAIPRDETSHAWTARTIAEWIREACNAICASPPRNSNGYRIASRKARRPPLHAWAYPSHSLQGRLVESKRHRHWQHGVDPAIWLFFGWLVPTPPVQ